MIGSKIKKSWDTLHRENRMRGALVVGLVIANVFLGLGLLTKRETVVIVPPGLEKEARIGASTANREFTEKWALFIAGLLGNVSPANADNIKGFIEKILSEEVHGEIIAALNKDIAALKDERVSQRFEARETIVEEDRDRVFVFGEAVMRGVAGNETRTERTYEMSITVRRYQPVVKYLRTYAGKPLTAKEAARRQQKEDDAAARERAMQEGKR